MTIKFRCNCGKTISAPETFAGRQCRCPSCGIQILVPTPGLSSGAVGDPAAGPAHGEPRASQSASAGVAQAVTTEKCENCGAIIGRLQTPAVVDGHVVCAACEPTVRAERQARNATPPADPLEELSASAQGAASARRTAPQKNVPDAVPILAALAFNPAQGLAHAFADLGRKRALVVGLVAAAFFDATVLLLIHHLGSASVAGDAMYSGSPPGDWSLWANAAQDLPFSVYFKTAVVFLLPLVSIALAMRLAGLVGRGKGPWEGDVFAAGMTLFPSAVFLLAISLLGILNADFLVALSLVALCYTILIIFHGLKDLAGLPPSLSAIAVPVTLIVSVYICKVVIVAMVR